MKKNLLLFTILLLVSCKNNDAGKNNDIKSVDSIAIYTDEKKEVPKIDSALIKKLKPQFDHKTDEFSKEKTTWIVPKTAPKFSNVNGLYIYFSENNLRLKFQYHSDSWLFINKAIFLIDGETYEVYPEKVNRNADTNGITESFDESYLSNKKLITALGNAKKAKIKLIGDQYVDYRDITQKQIVSIKKTFEYYTALGNQY